MSEVWWHVSHLKPAYVCYLAHAALPEGSGQLPLWREIAEVVLPQLDETSRGILVRCCCRRRRRCCCRCCLWAGGLASCLTGCGPAHPACPPVHLVFQPAFSLALLIHPSSACCLQRRAWFNYSKRLAKIAAGVSKWVQRLQQYSVQATGAMATNASQALQVCVPWWHAACANLVTAPLGDCLISASAVLLMLLLQITQS
jgi:hypothetical protein